jgi:CBS domain-containing protein
MSQPTHLTAADIMTKKVVTKEPNDDLTRIAADMQRNNIGSVVIVENRKLVGILTERDFVRIVERLGALLDKSLAKDHMTTPVFSIGSDASILDIIKLMSEKHVRHLVVLDKNDQVTGIISSRDLMKAAKDVMSI